MNIAFLAHDKKKELMVQFCTAYKSVLMKHNLFATATTGRLIADNTGLPITLLLSHKQGGHQQINAIWCCCLPIPIPPTPGMMPR